MKNIVYQITFFDFWHIGSGLTGSTYADGIVLKNNDGLPVIPGKSLKGLLREAAVAIHKLDKTMVSGEFIDDIFGMPQDKSSVGKEGCAFFTNAGLSKYLSEAIIKKEMQSTLYQVLASTKIDANGQAENHSLRQLEVTIPLTLYATINDFPLKPEYDAQLQHCFNWVKQMGLNRNHGLGRCYFSIKN